MTRSDSASSKFLGELATGPAGLVGHFTFEHLPKVQYMSGYVPVSVGFYSLSRFAQALRFVLQAELFACTSKIPRKTVCWKIDGLAASC